MSNTKLRREKLIFGNLTTNDTIPFEIDIEGDMVEYEFDYINYHCSCTKGVYSRGAQKVIGHVDLSKVGVSAGRQIVEKYVTVLLDPDVREFICNDDGKRIPNSEKRKLSFLISGTVEFVD